MFYLYAYMISAENLRDLKYQTLKEFWGYTEFRAPQEGIIDSILSGKDTVALLPTGGGKSLCYQLPALLSEGVCLVVSPLLALMKDQVEQLNSIGIEADYLSSDLDTVEEDLVYSRAKEGVTKLLYISPERLSNQRFLMETQDIQLSFIAVDEAHCVSEWGQDFRPSYRNIKMFREQYYHLPCIALTATATPRVLTEIVDKLALKAPQIFKKGFRRENIHINVLEISDKYPHIYHYLNMNRTSGLIYTRTRREAEELSQYLQSRGLTNVDYYHAGLPKDERIKKQNWWQRSSLNVLISTNAFGMGIDKENVYFVIHLSPSQSIENYYQEIGRAGRDGAESFAHLLWDKQDLLKVDKILRSQYTSKEEYQKIISYLYSMFGIAEQQKVEKEFQFSLEKLLKLTAIGKTKLKSVLNFLHIQEVIYLREQKNRSSIELLIPYDQIELLPEEDAYFIELLLRNIIGFTAQKVHFDEEILSEKLESPLHLIKKRLSKMKNKGYMEYIDGGQASIKFLTPRDERLLFGKYYKTFSTIQKNKVRKWEEMKFFITDISFCKMRLILQYFGERNAQDCGNCSYCSNRFQNNIKGSPQKDILNALASRPLTLDELCIAISNGNREEVLEHLILLRDSGKIKMQDYKTYMLV